MREKEMDEIERHFDELASEYDRIKQRNWFYYENLKNQYKKLVSEGKRVLEIGCGTGEVLAAMRPSFGAGIDISEQMIAEARIKFKARPELQFFKAGAADFKSSEKFDYILLPDVIEHLSDVRTAMRNIKSLAGKETTFIISMANPLWEPVLWFAEKLKLKMEEGPHYRISLSALKEILQTEGFRVEEVSYFLHLPIYIPFLSNSANKFFSKIPLLNKLGVLIFILVKKV